MTDNQDIQERTLTFAVRVVKLCRFLHEKGGIERILSSQLIRSGTSIGANVREAQSGQSDRDFLHKMEIALKEARETEYWLIVLVESGGINENNLNSLNIINSTGLALMSEIKKKPTKIFSRLF